MLHSYSATLHTSLVLTHTPGGCSLVPRCSLHTSSQSAVFDGDISSGEWPSAGLAVLRIIPPLTV